MLENARTDGIVRWIASVEIIGEGRREVAERESFSNCASRLEGCIRSFMV